MIRQYYAQRCRGGDNPLRVGVIPVGAIFYVQEDCWWRDRFRGRPVCREPWIVEAFLNGTIGAGRRNRETGLWESVFIAGRSDTAVIRSLRTGRRRPIAVRVLILHEDEGLQRDETMRGKSRDAELHQTGHAVARLQRRRDARPVRGSARAAA